jgi:hypothetical protein
MISIVFGIITIFHGMVHLLYFGQSARFFELQPGMVWPSGSWAFSKLLGNGTTRILANISLVLAAMGYAGVEKLPKTDRIFIPSSYRTTAEEY